MVRRKRADVAGHKFAWFQCARPDHMRVKCSSCCFSRELLSFISPRKLDYFDKQHLTHFCLNTECIELGGITKHFECLRFTHWSSALAWLCVIISSTVAVADWCFCVELLTLLPALLLYFPKLHMEWFFPVIANIPSIYFYWQGTIFFKEKRLNISEAYRKPIPLQPPVSSASITVYTSSFSKTWQTLKFILKRGYTRRKVSTPPPASGQEV